MNVLVEGSAPEADALVGLLTGEGHTVEIATSDADFEGGAYSIAYLDVWTPPVAQRVARLRAAGTRLSCLSDLLLERASIPTIGVTGTAGKSTTSAFVIQLLRAAGVPVIASTTARSGNLWATEESLAALDATDGVHVVELTSSHLAFMRSSPHVAVITSFWPDHLELHGSLQAYRSAKEQIVRHQRPGDRVVVGADVVAFAELTPAERWVFGETETERAAFASEGRLVVRTPVGDVDVGEAPVGVRLQATLAALAAVAAFGVPPEELVRAADRLEPPPFRARRVGTRGTTALIDDGMSATPAKTVASLLDYGPASVVLVAGGALEAAGARVHASPEEEALFEDALAVIAGRARHVVAFGPAGDRIAAGFAQLGARVDQVETLADAVTRALAAGTAAEAIIVSPMFPLSLAERERIATLLTQSPA